jgi:tellurite methyltransferase
VSHAERDKWNERYLKGAYEDRTHPTVLLADWLPRLPRGRALDVACGAGRNALFLAAQGYAVDAIDISSVALGRTERAATEHGLEVTPICADLDENPELALPDQSYELIVVVRYVNAALMPLLRRHLSSGGALLCEQHLVADVEVAGPRGAAFRLAPNELRAAAAGMHVHFYREGIVIDPDGRSVCLAQLVATRED